MIMVFVNILAIFLHKNEWASLVETKITQINQDNNEQ